MKSVRAELTRVVADVGQGAWKQRRSPPVHTDVCITSSYPEVGSGTASGRNCRPQAVDSGRCPECHYPSRLRWRTVVQSSLL
jgi:hypothetical protein